jgi:hypothetical protein
VARKVICRGRSGVVVSFFSSATWIRETVLRIRGTTLNRVDRVGRFRFGMKGEESVNRVVVRAPAV